MVKLWRRCGQQNNEKQIVKETIIKSGETPTENYNDRDYNCVENYENCDEMITIMLTIMTILGGYYEEGMADDFWLLTSHCAESQNQIKLDTCRHFSKWIFSQSISDLQDHKTQQWNTLCSQNVSCVYCLWNKNKQQFTKSPRVLTSNVTFQLGLIILRTNSIFCNLTRKGCDMLHLLLPPPKNQHGSGLVWIKFNQRYILILNQF